MNKWVLCGLCIFMLIVIMFSSCSSCSYKETMANMTPEDYIVDIVLEMKKHKEEQTEFNMDMYVIEYMKLHKETIKEMISRLEDIRFFDILKKKTGVSDIETITELKDNLKIIHGQMK